MPVFALNAIKSSVGHKDQLEKVNLELSCANFLQLCQGHHLEVGHLGSWHSMNPAVEALVPQAQWQCGTKVHGVDVPEACQAWQQRVQQRPALQGRWSVADAKRVVDAIDAVLRKPKPNTFNETQAGRWLHGQ